jgi:hypothetical protein
VDGGFDIYSAQLWGSVVSSVLYFVYLVLRKEIIIAVFKKRSHENILTEEG